MKLTEKRRERDYQPTVTVVGLPAPEAREYLATAVLSADFSGADAQTYARRRIRSCLDARQCGVPAMQNRTTQNWVMQ